MITEALLGAAFAFAVSSIARSHRPRIETVTMSFETAMRLKQPLMIPDCLIGGVQYPEMRSDVFNTAAALQLIRERQGC